MLGLTLGSYEAYCLDQAVWYFGTTVDSELEKAGRGKKSKGQASTEAARKRVLAKYMSSGNEDTKKTKYRDPVASYNERMNMNEG